MLLAVTLVTARPAAARADSNDDKDWIPAKGEERSARERIYEGRNLVILDGDTVRQYFLRPVTIWPRLKFKNDKEKAAYDRLVRNIKVIFFPTIKENFRIRTTWTFPYFPEIIFKFSNMIFWYA